MFLSIGRAGRTKADMRRARKALAAEKAARAAQRINIPVGTYRPSFFDDFGNEYWYDEQGRKEYPFDYYR